MILTQEDLKMDSQKGEKK